ncbi:hypothetical protein [Stenotrophomonas phage A1432]|uniref:Uncharacterized protein n=1 Tax=Stenotrophomonas phage A1432 TaxID=2930315 RepID=A0A9E7ST64_9CAUD|nr:hypothetical protein P9A45_gp15 [Stenotrophomonas phage A1432]UTC28015.1 hypothetical protein [Stenotrophomonas phage A1432]
MKDLASEMKKLEACDGDPDRTGRIFSGTPNQDDLKWAHQTALKEALLEFIQGEANLVKGLAHQGKKDLAREVVHLRSVIKTIKDATKRLQPGEPTAPTFQHAEAFRVMHYTETSLPTPANPRHTTPLNPKRIVVWNSRDGVTPFILHLNGVAYEHEVRSMGPVTYDLPDAAGYKWVTRTTKEVLEAWNRTLDRAVKIGKIPQEKADQQRNNLPAAESWNYRIGLVDLATGRYTDEQLEEMTDGISLVTDPE